MINHLSNQKEIAIELLALIRTLQKFGIINSDDIEHELKLIKDEQDRIDRQRGDIGYRG